MKTEILKYATREVPRYTSYPTAVQFHDGIGEAQARNWLAGVPEGELLSLYVHIPFCEKMCWYCGCHTNVVTGYERIKTYVDDLLTEMDLVSAALSPKAGQVHHLHFGGGSPSMLASSDFAAIIEKLQANFSFAENSEIAIEIDPRTMSADKAARYAKAGVTRASLGVQDFNLHVQEKINRIQPPEMVRQVQNWLFDVGISAINFDLIYGLPGQGSAEITRTLEIALEMRPDRFAVFGYAHVPWFKKHQQMILDEDLPDVHERLAQADLVAKILTDAGYVRIGFDHYARPNDSLAQAVLQNRVRRNFQGYTDDNCDTLLAFGASSISALPQGYLQNDPQMGKWRNSVRDGHLPIVRGVELSDDDRFRGAAIMEILSRGSLDLAAHCRAFGQPETALDGALEKLSLLAEDGLLVLDGRKVQITENGIRFSRNAAACFDNHWKPEKKRHSLAV
jgi:oxygen-independent coproporphyrinogen-3 oxidase